MGANAFFGNCSFIGNGLFFDAAFGGQILITNSAFVATGAGIVGIDYAVGGSSGSLIICGTQFRTVAGSFGIRVNNQNQVSSGMVTTGVFTGGGTVLSGFTKASNNWQFVGSTGVNDSKDVGLARSAPGTAAPGTVALTQNTWAPISDGGTNLTYSLGATAEKFTVNDANTGELIYNGVLTRTYMCQVVVSLENANAGTNVIQIGLDLNGTGTPIADSIFAQEIEQNRFDLHHTAPFAIELAPGDRVEALVQNITSNDDIDVADMSLTIWI